MAPVSGSDNDYLKLHGVGFDISNEAAQIAH